MHTQEPASISLLDMKIGLSIDRFASQLITIPEMSDESTRLSTVCWLKVNRGLPQQKKVFFNLAVQIIPGVEGHLRFVSINFA